MLGASVGCWLADCGSLGLIIGLNGGGLVALAVVVGGLLCPAVRPEILPTTGLMLLLAASAVAAVAPAVRRAILAAALAVALAVDAAADPTPLATRFITDGLSTFE